MPNQSGPLLLIVDDDMDGREGLAEYLGFMGFDVAQARTGLEAVDQAMRLGPELIILDMALPEMDGCEVLGCLRTDERTVKTPVIVLSACVFPRDRERAMSAGCNLFLSKPCSPDDVYSAVRRLLKERQLAD